LAMRTRELELVAAVLLFPPRFAVMAVAEVLAYLVCSIATIGHDPAVPLVPWRRQLMRNVVVPCCHVVLATIGIWSVRIDGMPDPSAKLVVCNHVCLLDGFVLVATLGAPSFVARLEGLAAVPLYGTIVRALQVLFVNRQDTASRRECADAIADRAQAAAGKWPPLVVFPEGTVSRRQLKAFRPGAFRPGAPVQPVTLRYDDGLPEDRPGGWLTDLLFIFGLRGRRAQGAVLAATVTTRQSVALASSGC